MQIAISGATGLIGSALCEQLAAAGHSLLRLVRPNGSPVRPGSAPDPASPSITSTVWDPEAGLACPEQLDGADAFFHLAGRSIAAGRWTRAEKQRIRDSRVHATETLARQLAELHSPPRVMISASAIGIYGNCGQRTVDEQSPPADDFLGRVAADWEAACQPLVHAGVRVVHPRLGIVLSSGGGALAKMLPLFRSMLGGRLGSGHQVWSWISLADCVAAMTWLMSQDSATGPYNLVVPQAVSNREFTAALARQLSRPAILPAPAFALRMILGEMANALLLSSCRVAPDRLVHSGFTFQHETLAGFLSEELA